MKNLSFIYQNQLYTCENLKLIGRIADGSTETKARVILMKKKNLKYHQKRL